MELVLTGSPTTAIEMERVGIVNRVVPSGQDVVAEALDMAGITAGFSAPAIRLAKQAVKTGKSVLSPLSRAHEVHLKPLTREAETTTLDAGLDIERGLYYSSFSSADCKEGIAAFLQKREACWTHE